MTSPALPSRPQITAWRNAVFVTFGLSGLAIATWLSRVPRVRDELEVSTTVIGIVLFGVAAGSIVGLSLASHIIARFGATRTLLLALGIGVFGLPIAAVGVGVDSVWLTFAGLALFGAGNGCCDVAMNVSGAANERMLGRAVMPIFHAMFSVGTVVGTAIGAAAEALDIPLLVHTGVMSVLILASLLVAVRFFQSELADIEPEEPGTESAHPGIRSRLSAWTEPRTLMIGVIVLGMAFAEGSANDWLALAMVDGHGLANDQAALVLSLFLLSMTVGRLAGVKLLDRFGRVPVLRASAVAAVLGLGLVIFVPDPAVAIAATVLWGLGAALGFPVGMSAAADDPRKAAGRVSVVSTIGYLAFLAGPPLIGFLGDHVGLLLGLIPVLVLIALAGIASPAAREPQPAAQERSAA
ncbi:MFS transporter [Herbiconiux sp. L3-i23]|uniref:MFS transporter n=1 Tax=Herbiconiux sp. L3-i23 TaxID=2905871 RepID=UPI00206BC424|nr:MFS transporter [Herbiconiux sp. L3-i23]BDI21278.1 MFS transporter [Herbiconiux sp. L3-i23]